MCDDDIHQGMIVDRIIENPALSRRAFGLMGAAAASAAASAAHAQVKVTEKNVTIKTADGTADAALYYPEGMETWPAVLMWPDVMSLRPAFREMGRRLAGQGYVVLVPNVYYRVKVAPVVEGSFNFNNPADREKLAPFRASVTTDGTDRDAAAFVAFLDAQPQTNKGKKVGVQGYCMGGALSFRTAAAVPNRIGAVVSFHGGGLYTDQRSSPHLLIPKSKAAYSVQIGQNDDKAEPDVKDKLKAAFDAAKLPAKVSVYSADHGWMVNTSAVYNMSEAERGWAEMLALYKRALA